MSDETREPISVALVDDHEIVREGLRRVFERAGDIDLRATFSEANALLRALPTLVCEVLVLDLTLPSRGGIELLRVVRAERSDVAVVVFSAWPSGPFAESTLQAGARAFVPKGGSTDELVEAIRACRSGPRRAPTPRYRRAASAFERLSPRERQVFSLLVRGKSATEIATDLRLSLSTVSTFVGHIRAKLGVESIAEMVRYAVREGLIE